MLNQIERLVVVFMPCWKDCKIYVTTMICQQPQS